MMCHTNGYMLSFLKRGNAYNGRCLPDLTNYKFMAANAISSSNQSPLLDAPQAYYSKVLCTFPVNVASMWF